MLMHPYLMLEYVKAREQTLLAEAERHRLRKSARAARRAARAEAAARQEVRQPLPRPLTGTLTTCGRHVAGSAR